MLLVLLHWLLLIPRLCFFLFWFGYVLFGLLLKLIDPLSFVLCFCFGCTFVVSFISRTLYIYMKFICLLVSLLLAFTAISYMSLLFCNKNGEKIWWLLSIFYVHYLYHIHSLLSCSDSIIVIFLFSHCFTLVFCW